MADRFVTAFHPEGFKVYGHRLVDSYEEFGPDSDMRIYASDFNTSSEYEFYNAHKLGNMHFHEQFEIPELAEFLDRHKDNPHVHGKLPDHRWKDKDRKAGYNYRYDMWKFSRMIYVMWAEAHRDPTGRMVWLDGDCVLRKQLPDDFIDRALPEGYAYSYLGRPGKYTETGVVCFKLPEALPILDTWAAYCTEDTFLQEREQHSAWLFDRAREQYGNLRGFNLTPNGRGHVIHQSWIGAWIDHLKGSRKLKDKSPEARP